MEERIIKVNTFEDATILLNTLEEMKTVIADLTEVENEEISNKIKNFIAGYAFGRGICKKHIEEDKILLKWFDIYPESQIREYRETVNVAFDKRNEIEDAARKFMDGKMVTFDVSELSRKDAMFAFDFLSGMVYSLSGGLEKEKDNVFTIIPVVKVIYLEDYEDDELKAITKELSFLKNNFEDESISKINDCYNKLYDRTLTKDWKIGLLYANFLIKNKKYSDAVPILKKVLKADLNGSVRNEVLILMINNYNIQGLFHKAVALLDEFKEEYIDPIILKDKRAYTYYMVGKYKKSIPLVKELVEFWESNKEGKPRDEAMFYYHFMLSDMYIGPSQLSDRIKSMEKITEYSRNLYGETVDLAINVCDLGELYIKNKEYDKAKVAFDKAKEILSRIPEEDAKTLSKCVDYVGKKYCKLPRKYRS